MQNQFISGLKTHFLIFCERVTKNFGPHHIVVDTHYHQLAFADGKITQTTSSKLETTVSISPTIPSSDFVDCIIENFKLQVELTNIRAEEKFKTTILDHLSDGVVACDENGFIRFFNEQTRNFHGLPHEPIPPDQWANHYDLYYPDTKIPLKKEDIPLFKAFNGTVVTDLPMVISPKGKKEIKILSSAKPLLDENGKKIGAIATMRDETELKRKLDKTESRFRTIFEQSPVSIQICSKSGKTLQVNPAWKKLWGIPEEIIQNYILKDYNILQDPVLDTQNVGPYIRMGFEGKVSHIPIIKYDANQDLEGNVRLVAGIVFPLMSPNGDFEEVAVMHLDVTEKEKLLSELNFLAKLTSLLISSLDYNHILTQIADACIPELADGCILDLIEDGAVKRIVTKHQDPEIAQLMEELQREYPPTLDSPQPGPKAIRTGKPEVLSKIDQKAILNHTFDAKHAELITKIGFHSSIAVPIIIRGKIIGSINLLITTKRPSFTEEDVKTAIEVSRRAGLAIENSQLYTKVQQAVLQRDEFISIASHELKTPLTSMKLQFQYAERLLKSDSTRLDAAYISRLVSNSNKQVDRITLLVDDMLDIARFTTGKLSINLLDTNVSALVEDICLKFQKEVEGVGDKLSFKIAPGIVARCDAFRIEQVMTNLLTNAVRYGNKKPIAVELSKINEEVTLKVQDMGPGIAPEDQERIFHRFERATSYSHISGLGLGLFISRQIMERHNGTLKVESHIGKGSTFIATFPIK